MVSNLPISVNKIKLSNCQAMIIIGFGGTDFRFDDEIDLLLFASMFLYRVFMI